MLGFTEARVSQANKGEQLRPVRPANNRVTERSEINPIEGESDEGFGVRGESDETFNNMVRPFDPRTEEPGEDETIEEIAIRTEGETGFRGDDETADQGRRRWERTGRGKRATASQEPRGTEITEAADGRVVRSAREVETPSAEQKEGLLR